MSEELRKNETEVEEVEGHVRRPVTDEPSDEGEDDDDEVEAHKRHMNARMDTTRKD